MGENKQRTREEIAAENKWTIDEMFPGENDWDETLKSALDECQGFGKYRGKVTSSAADLLAVLELSDDVDMKIEDAYCYAHMKLDEDNTVSKSQDMMSRIETAAARAGAMTSFIMPEIVTLDKETIDRYIEEEPKLSVYRHLLMSAIREKDHVLSDKEENILAELSEVLGAPDTVFTMLNDADMKFGTVHDDKGEEIELTHGNYVNLMRSHNREVRKEAYEKTYEKYKGLVNTLTATYQANVKTDVISSRLRKYSSSREAALYGNDIPEEVYDNLITEVHKALPSLHEYIKLRKDVLKLDELRMYDVYVPLVELPERKLSFDEAVSLAVKGLSPLGEDYIREFLDGVGSGWIDRYENAGKTSGAYSFGSYRSKPYVLMNYDETLEDLFTLVHEMGHSMNSLYTRRTQPFVYGDHSIFTAEVASTVNETLMMRYLLENEKDPEMKKYILNMYIEAFRTTLFRQTMFAEFEKICHDAAENGESLTPDYLNSAYDELNNEYFGPALTHDDLIQYEWSRIPHFYRSFYVYQYATGYSAANAIANRILSEGEPARKDYLEFLSCGTNDYPVELLKIAGVDMSSGKPVKDALSTFSELVTEFGKMI